uniref:Hypothetical membrane protein n=2 Tax=Thermococcus sp. AMT11 TaxID=563043 RepID=C8BND4_9EURY|nr:hypothetical membrane protein [Thermococcus sp. AMT11]
MRGGKMRRRHFELLVLLYIIGILGLQLVSAANWGGWVRLGDELQVGNYTVTFDVNRNDNRTYALVYEGPRLVGIYMVDFNPVQVGNLSIVSSRKNLDNMSIKIFLTFPDNWTLSLNGAQLWPPVSSTEPALSNSTNSTASNTTSQNQTVSNQTAPAPAPSNQTLSNQTNQTNATLECSTLEECQALIQILEQQLEQERAEKAKLLEKIQELEQQIQYLQQQQNLTQLEKQQYEQQIKELQKQIEILQEALQEKNQRIAELEEELARLQKKTLTWEGIKNTTEEWYLGWVAPWGMPIVTLGLLYAVRRWRPRAIKAKQYAIEEATNKVLEEMQAKKILSDMMEARIDPLVEDPALLEIIKSIVPQLTGSQEVTRKDILDLDVDEFLKLAADRYLLKEDRLEYLKDQLEKLKERVRDSLGGVA